ncbi:host specificity factor TipJ family phage tail protein [Parvibaculum sp.]|uniref:host specificity factor TipJ family phage tail protein n=1 Tax=Parvibaculum sp. TaxID=2024848 RepID=UPI003918CD59
MKHRFDSSLPAPVPRVSRRERRKSPAQAMRIRTPFALGAAEPLDLRRNDTIRTLAARQRFRGPVIAVLNGEPVLRKGRGWSRRLRRGDRLAFVERPAGGEGGKNIFRTVLNIAIVLTSTVLLGSAGLGLTGVALAGGVLAVQVASGYLLNALLPPEAPGGTGFRGGETASPTYNLGTAQNRARLNQVRPRQYGRHLIVPDLDAAPYTEYAGNDQYLYQVLNCGLGDYATHAVRLAETDVWTETEGDTGNFEDVTLEFLPPGAPVTLFPTGVTAAAEVNGIALPGTNEDGAGWAGPFVCNAAGTEAKFLAFDFEWQQGAGRYTDSGGLVSVTTRLRIEAREIDEAGDPLGDWEVLKEEDYSFATLTPQRISERISVEPGRYEARVKRANDSTGADDDKARDAVTWTALRAYLTGESGSLDCFRLAVRMKASGQLSGLSSRLFRVLQTAKLPVYQGRDGEGAPQWSAPQETRSIFAAAADIMRNADYGGGLPDARIDLDRFASLEATWAARGDTFDGVFDTKTSCWAALQDVLRAGRAEPQMAGDVVTVQRDEPRSVASAVFSAENIAAGSFGVDYVFADPDTPDAVLVEFWNEDIWGPDEVLAKLPGSTAENPARISLFGVTDRTRAWRHGMYLAAVNRYRRAFPYLTSGLEGRLLARGKKVLVSHPLPEWGTSVEVVSYTASSRLLRVEDKVTLGEGQNWLHLRNRKGRPWGPCRVTAGPSARQLVLDAGDVAALGSPAAFIVTGEDRERTVAVIGEASGAADQAEGPVECLVVTSAPAGGERVMLALNNDDPRVYTADEGDPPPVSGNPVPPSTPRKPVLQPIVVSQNIGTVYAPRLSYSVQPAAGAEIYLWSVSYDHITWTEIKEGSTATSGETDVRPSTVWIACTAIGPGGRDRKEAFRDLTVTDAPPGEVTGIVSRPLAEQAMIDFVLPKADGDTEEGLRGVLARYSATPGFDPEDGEALDVSVFTVRHEPAVTRLLVPLIASPTYIRLAAYNVFGEAGLNWSSEISLTPAKLTSENFSPAVVEALANAAAIEGAWVVRLDSNGRIAGVAIVEEGELGGTVTAGWLVDKFQIAHPAINGGDPFPAFVVEEGQVKVNELVATTITAEEIYAALISVGRIEGLVLSSPLGPGETVNDAAAVFDLSSSPYLIMRKLA